MATIKSFEVDRWSEKDEKGRVKHVGMLKMREVFEMLKEHLLSKDMLPDEYFLMSQNDWNEDRELPEYDYALCVPNYGGSEGIYLDISLVYQDEQERTRITLHKVRCGYFVKSATSVVSDSHVREKICQQHGSK